MNNFSVKILFILVLISASIQSLNAQWFVQPSGTQNNLQCIFFTDETTGYSCGDNVILKTTNAGVYWSKSDLPGIWNSICFVNSATGYISGTNGRIMKTTNVGMSWTALESGTLKNLTNIRFANETTGYFTGWGKTLLKTSDAGNSFSNTFGSAYYMWQKSFIQNNYIFLVGTESALFRSSDSGITWDSLDVGMPNSLSCTYFYPNGTGFVFGCCGSFFKTTDYGNSWMNDTIYLTKGWALEDCSFQGNKGWSVGEVGSIVRTSDAGNTWEALSSGTDIHLNSVKFINSQTGWIAGREGIILKTTNGGGAGIPIGIENNSVVIPENFSLQQNFPNPFNPSTVIKFALNNSSNVSLKIFDAAGNLISTLAENFYKQGEYTITWNAEVQPSGIYFCKMETNNGSRTIKMLLIK